MRRWILFESQIHSVTITETLTTQQCCRAIRINHVDMLEVTWDLFIKGARAKKATIAWRKVRSTF